MGNSGMRNNMRAILNKFASFFNVKSLSLHSAARISLSSRVRFNITQRMKNFSRDDDRLPGKMEKYNIHKHEAAQ